MPPDPIPDSAFPFVEIEIRVRYAETDQMKVAHHANYFVWFELARSEFCRAHGIDYKAMEADGLFLPILEAHCRYRLPARYDDLITIRAEVIEIKSRTLRIRYTVKRDNELLADAETLQMLIGPDGRPRTFPSDAAARFRSRPPNNDY